jgi:hypothetical protein
MKRPVRWRRGAKFVGLAASVLIFVAWVASAWFYADVGFGRWYAVVTFGQLRVNRSLRIVDEPAFAGYGRRQITGLDWNFALLRGPSGDCLNTPLWAPFLLTALVTAYLMRTDKQKVSGCLNCGYSREGLATNACCPECGKPRH